MIDNRYLLEDGDLMMTEDDVDAIEQEGPLGGDRPLGSNSPVRVRRQRATVAATSCVCLP